MPIDDETTLSPPPPVDPAFAIVEIPLLVTPVPELGLDVYTNTHALWKQPLNIPVFGGIILGQCLNAAQNAVPPTLAVYSMHCSFIRPGRATCPIFYHVERASDSRSFSLRIVRAMQNDICIFTATCGFQKNHEGDKIRNNSMLYSLPMPVRREEPDDVSSQTQNVNLDAMGFEASEDIPDPYDWRHLPDLPSNSSSPTAVRLHSWVRTTTPLSTPSPLTHLAALALLTDSWFIETVNLVDPLSVGPRSEKVALETSLNHVVHFHEPLARADEWMFVERTSSWAGRNRGHVEQRIWGRGGNLLVSSWQEGVVRLRRREGKL